MKSENRREGIILNKTGSKNEKQGWLVSLFRSSVILTSIDKFTAYIYSLIKNGFFGFIFSGYRNETGSRIADRITSTKTSHHLGELRYGICRCIEQSIIVNLIDRFMKYLLKCRLKVYGAFMISFGAYSAVITAVNAFADGNAESLLGNRTIVFSLILIIASIPLIFSRINLAESLTNSLVGRFILKITGFSADNPALSHESKGQSSISFLIGVILAFAAHIIAPNNGALYVILGAAAAVCAYLVLLKPEIGVLAIFFALPFLPTMALAAIVIYTFVCWIIKVFRGKRVVKFEPIDIVVMAFAVILLSGGLISLSPESLKPALLMVCLIAGYFLTVQLIRKREWIVRCSSAAVISAALVSLYGVFMYYTGGGYFSQAWIDDEMFGISNRAVSTLENPNMLGEYLIIVIPIALAMLIGRGEGLRRLPAFFCLGAMGVCLLLTWSRGAWLALILALIIFILMLHHRSIWLVLAGICAIPILPSVLPASIISRFTSIGNMSDSSTSYRVYIWRAAVNMIKDNSIAGIGIGESAWKRMYPLYSYMGIEVAPHSHNLFMQIWLETGIFGFVAFLLIIFLLLQSVFTLFRRLSSNSSLNTPDISEKMMLTNNSTLNGKLDAQRISKKQLRLSVIGPAVGIIAVLIQGLTDYSWYNYRLYLFFWIIAGLCSAYVRSGISFIADEKAADSTEESTDTKFIIKSDKRNKKSGTRVEETK